MTVQGSAAAFVHVFCRVQTLGSGLLDILDVTWPPRADSSVTLARGRRVSSLDCPMSFWTHWLKPLTSAVRFWLLLLSRFSLCLSFYLFVSNPAPLPLPPSSLHSLNSVLLLCPLCCHTVCNCFSIFCFSPSLLIHLLTFLLSPFVLSC